jgi:hypothetical protein
MQNNRGISLNGNFTIGHHHAEYAQQERRFSRRRASQLQLVQGPPLRETVNAPPITNPDITPPAAPTIASSTPDTGTVGDQITTANVLTLSGTAEAGSIVKLFDGSTQIGTTRANASGNWTYATAKLPEGTHSFTETATDAAGNSSSGSSPLNVKVDAVGASSSPSSPTPTQRGENLPEERPRGAVHESRQVDSRSRQ